MAEKYIPQFEWYRGFINSSQSKFEMGFFVLFNVYSRIEKEQKMEFNLKEIAGRIKDLREAKGYSQEELAKLCSVSAEEAATAIDATSPIVSLYDNVYGEEGMTIENTIPDLEASSEMERLCDRIALGQAIRKMPDLWQKIVLLRYYRDMTQQQVANLMGLSQVKISREEKKIMSFLRGEMAT